MKEPERWAWYGGTFLGLFVGKALARPFPVASIGVFGATAVWFIAWLLRDNLQFKNEVAALRQRLDERKAAVRAAREAARRGGGNEPRS